MYALIFEASNFFNAVLTLSKALGLFIAVIIIGFSSSISSSNISSFNAASSFGIAVDNKIGLPCSPISSMPKVFLNLPVVCSSKVLSYPP